MSDGYLHGKFVWFEHLSNDVGAASAFYQSLFGWRTERIAMGEAQYPMIHNGAQPIDQMVFRDSDGTYYIVYGGRRHCNIAKLNRDFTGFLQFDDGSTFKEITPKGYVEGGKVPTDSAPTRPF